MNLVLTEHQGVKFTCREKVGPWLQILLLRLDSESPLCLIATWVNTPASLSLTSLIP